MTKASRRSVAIAAALMTITLSGCGGEDGPRGVLTEDDVPNVRVAFDDKEDLGIASCFELGPAELKLSLDNGETDHHRRFTLEDGDVVGSSVNGVSSRYESAAEALDTIGSVLDDCTTRPPQAGTTIEKLPNLESGTYGYRSTLTTRLSRSELTRVFAPHDDYIVTVSVLHTGEDESAVDILDLLDTALERADELDD
jgi:hypothetical protein